jgi:hypothetical protein
MSGRARLLATAVVAALAAAPAGAADWSFDPAVEIGAERSDNLNRAGGGAELPEGEWATAYTGSVTLALSATSPRSSTSFSYRPFFERYDEYSELDNTSHDVSFSWSWTASRRTTWDATLGWSRRERQRLLFDEPDLDQVALPRTRNDALRGAFGTSVRAGRHSDVSFRLSHTANSYDADTVTVDERALRLDDSSSTNLSADFGYRLSERKSLGVVASAGRNDSGFRGEVDTYSLQGSYEWTGRSEVTVGLRLGATTTSVQDPGVDAEGDPLPAYDESAALTGGIDVNGRVSRYVTLNGGVSRDVTTGTGVSGAVESLSVFAACNWQLRRYSSLRFSGRYAQRDDLDREAEASAAVVSTAADTTSYRAEWRAAVSPSWQLVLSAERFDQSTDEVLDTAEAELLTLDYTIYGLSIRWAPGEGRR